MVFMIIVFCVLGLCAGSFLNVVIYRVPKGLSIIKPRSACPKCERQIRFYENIPVLSFIFLRGKCRGCGEPISIRYPVIEIVTALLWVLPLPLGLSVANAVIAALFSSILLAVFVIDFELLIIPNELVLSVIALSIPTFFVKSDIFWYERLIGFAAGGGILYLLAVFSERVFKKEGMGGGDIKLMAACGLILGWQNILLSLFLAALVAMLAVLLVLTPLKKKFPIGETIPFAPALSIAMVISYYFGSQIIFWYLSRFIVI